MKIRLQNFQSHTDTTVELAPAGALTVITGPTDSGKTAIIRAYRLVAYNEPQGDSYIRVGAQSCRVTVTLDDGTQIIRERSRGGVNRYILARPNEKPLTFEGFGSEVPAEIQQALSVHELTIGDLTIRPGLAEQLEGPFLGRSVPATARAKVLGALAGADDVDAANRAVGTDLYRANQDVKRLEADLAANEKAQAELAWVEPLGQALDALNSLAASVATMEDRRNRLTTLAARIAQHNMATQAVEATLTRLADLPRAATLVGEATLQADRAARLAGLAERIRGHHATEETNRADLDRLARVADAAVLAAQIETQAVRLERLRSIWTRFRAITQQSAQVEAVLARRADIEAAQARLAVIEESLATSKRLMALAARVAEVDRREAETREAQVVLENDLVDLRGALEDAIREAVVRCPKCGYEFVPENLKEVA